MRESFALKVYRATTPRGVDAWPRTHRILPWLLAGFLVLLFLVPIGGIKLDVPSPVDPLLDRYALGVILAIWIGAVLLGRRQAAVERPMLFIGATVLFVGIALLSVVVNITDVANHDLLSLTQNRIALLLAFIAFAFFTVSAMRPEELHNFSIFVVILASICAVGVIWERRTGFSIFYDAIGHLFDPFASVADAPTEINPDPEREARKTIVGPTEHGLAVSTMLSLVVPFAVVGFMERRDSKRWLYALAIGLIFGATLSTERKTGVLAPVAAMLVIAAYRPRAALRMAPLLLVLVLFIKVASPGALGTITELKETFTSDSSEGRSDDYVAIGPEVLEKPLLGSGYGSRDILDIDHVRILDNEYLAVLLTTGLFGLLAFIVMILSSMVLAHRVIRSGDPARAGPALAASASCAVFLITCALFDSLSFSQAPYAFFFVAGMATVAATRPASQRAAARARAGAPIPSRWRTGAPTY
jgi:uncharacterized membrane protein SirB2